MDYGKKEEFPPIELEILENTDNIPYVNTGTLYADEELPEPYSINYITAKQRLFQEETIKAESKAIERWIDGLTEAEKEKIFADPFKLPETTNITAMEEEKKELNGKNKWLPEELTMAQMWMYKLTSLNAMFNNDLRYCYIAWSKQPKMWVNKCINCDNFIDAFPFWTKVVGYMSSRHCMICRYSEKMTNLDKYMEVFKKFNEVARDIRSHPQEDILHFEHIVITSDDKLPNSNYLTVPKE